MEECAWRVWSKERKDAAKRHDGASQILRLGEEERECMCVCEWVRERVRERRLQLEGKSPTVGNFTRIEKARIFSYLIFPLRKQVGDRIEAGLSGFGSVRDFWFWGGFGFHRVFCASMGEGWESGWPCEASPAVWEFAPAPCSSCGSGAHWPERRFAVS